MADDFVVADLVETPLFTQLPPGEQLDHIIDPFGIEQLSHTGKPVRVPMAAASRTTVRDSSRLMVAGWHSSRMAILLECHAMPCKA